MAQSKRKNIYLDILFLRSIVIIYAEHVLVYFPNFYIYNALEVMLKSTKNLRISHRVMSEKHGYLDETYFIEINQYGEYPRAFSLEIFI